MEEIKLIEENQLIQNKLFKENHGLGWHQERRNESPSE